MSLVLGSGIAAALASYFGVLSLRRWALARRILDIPNQRSSHTEPTPRGGGLPIVVITLICAGLLALVDKSALKHSLLSYLIGGALIAAISWWDDLRSTPIGLRLLVHSGAAVLAIVGVGVWSTVPFTPSSQFPIGWLGVFITFLWIVGLTNAYNFMDGIDGLAGLQALVAGALWAFVAWQSGNLAVCLLSVSLASATLGFLGLNWPPATIFMGDVGSAFLGYSFAVLPLLAERGGVAGGHLILGVLVVWPFVYDTTFTFVRRAIRRERLMQSHRTHIYQRLMIAGWKVRDITVLYGGLASLTGLAGVCWFRTAVNSAAMLAVLTTPGAVLTFLVLYSERRVRRIPAPPPAEAPGTVSKN